MRRIEFVFAYAKTNLIPLLAESCIASFEFASARVGKYPVSEQFFENARFCPRCRRVACAPMAYYLQALCRRRIQMPVLNAILTTMLVLFACVFVCMFALSARMFALSARIFLWKLVPQKTRRKQSASILRARLAQDEMAAEMDEM